MWLPWMVQKEIIYASLKNVLDKNFFSFRIFNATKYIQKYNSMSTAKIKCSWRTGHKLLTKAKNFPISYPSGLLKIYCYFL